MNKKYIALGLLALAAGIGYYFFIYKKKAATNTGTNPSIKAVNSADQAVFNDILQKIVSATGQSNQAYVIGRASGFINGTGNDGVGNSDVPAADYTKINGKVTASGALLQAADMTYGSTADLHDGVHWANTTERGAAYDEYWKFYSNQTVNALFGKS